MTKPTTNLERLNAIRRGLEKILDKRKAEQARWLDALGGIKETALTDLKLAAGIGQVEGMLSALDTVIKTDYSPSSETARVDGPDKRGVPTKVFDPEDKSTLARLIRTGKVGYSEAVKALREDCGCGAQECPTCLLNEYAEFDKRNREKVIQEFVTYDWEKLGTMLKREGEVAPVPGGAGLHYDCPDIITTLRKPEGELDDIEFTILKTRKPEVNISFDGEAVALRGEGVKDRIAATEAEALARKAPVHSMNLGAADTPRKHTAQNISQLRIIVKKALELSVTDRLNIFDMLGLFDVETGKCFGAVQGIQEAFQCANDLGKVKLGELICAIERLYNERNC